MYSFMVTFNGIDSNVWASAKAIFRMTMSMVAIRSASQLGALSEIIFSLSAPKASVRRNNCLVYSSSSSSAFQSGISSRSLSVSLMVLSVFKTMLEAKSRSSFQKIPISSSQSCMCSKLISSRRRKRSKKSRSCSNPRSLLAIYSL